MTDIILKVVLDDGIFIVYTVVICTISDVANQLNRLDESFKKFIVFKIETESV